MQSRNLCLVAFVSLALAGLGFADTQADAKSAAAAYSQGDFARAITLYKSITVAEPKNADAWEQLGESYLSHGDFELAAAAFQSAMDACYWPQMAQYRKAAAYAHLKRKDDAIQLLTVLVDAGFSPGSALEKDPDLVNLVGDARFAAIAEKVRRMNEPCRDPNRLEFRQLDFWVGEWDVFSGTQKTGESSVQLILKDCVVLENWRGIGGDEGKSLNKYNQLLKKWQQFWVADNGATNLFTGELVEGEMRYVVERPMRNGGTLIRHMTFTPQGGGKVRQFSQASTDGGKTWNTEYDFLYVRRK